LLAAFAMPLACLIGTVIAVLRLQGDEKSPLPEFLPMPWPVRKLIHLLCDVWVELIRGTPLLFQLMVVYFILPQLGLRIDPFTSGVIALAINYSAYEAEIVRLGIQAIPRGQLEAALALGLSPWQATARIILPQAWRLVIPATANDFIALFKDTAVCSTISVMELSKQFNISYQSTQLIVESAALASALYLAMSYPLSIAARRLERWLKEER
jgi:polar amino acid transport system substrate-binding protein